MSATFIESGRHHDRRNVLGLAQALTMSGWLLPSGTLPPEGEVKQLLAFIVLQPRPLALLGKYRLRRVRPHGP